ncbi:MAG: sensor histidine kinase, partial [Methylobacterium sp.]|nr:sensor histidine kinase [Methylobacterium sp.]
DQHLHARSLWDFDLVVPPVAPGREQLGRTPGPEHKPLLVVAHGYRKQGRDLTIAVAEDLSAMQAAMRHFRLIYALLSLAGLALLLVVQRRIMLRALAPLHDVRQDMARLANGEIAQLRAAGPSEIQPLINELNRLLAGLDRKTRRSRESLGNLAHALKTRLTLLNQLAEREEIRAVPELREALYASTGAIGQSIERELKRARLVGQMHPGRRVDLPAELGPLVDTLRRLYADKALAITVEIEPGATFSGDREDLLEMLGNLLDNACKWSAGQVRLEVRGGEATRFIVEDDGPGCLPGALESLTLRGFRADESRPGSGLGLAIVRDIVDSYDGRLDFGRSSTLGGLRVEACFPPAGISAG